MHYARSVSFAPSTVLAYFPDRQSPIELMFPAIRANVLLASDMAK